MAFLIIIISLDMQLMIRLVMNVLFKERLRISIHVSQRWAMTGTSESPFRLLLTRSWIQVVITVPILSWHPKYSSRCDMRSNIVISMTSIVYLLISNLGKFSWLLVLIVLGRIPNVPIVHAESLQVIWRHSKMHVWAPWDVLRPSHSVAVTHFPLPEFPHINQRLFIRNKVFASEEVVLVSCKIII